MSAERGFSILELWIALAVGLALTASLTALIRFQANWVRRQVQTADLQQSMRIAGDELARAVRCAGRGAPPGDAMPAGLAIEVRNGGARRRRLAGAGSPELLAGTDVLIVRGVGPGALLEVATVESRGPTAGALSLRSATATGAPQALRQLEEEALEGEALILTGPPGTPGCAIVELVGAARASGRELLLEFDSGGSRRARAFRELARRCPQVLNPLDARRVGVLREHRYFVRRGARGPDGHADHRLARARFLPGSDVAHPSGTRHGVDLVDHALDLQIALGLDRDWLFDDVDDDPERPPWSESRTRLVRITLLLRSARAWHGYRSAPLGRLEDHRYDEPEVPEGAALSARRFGRLRSTRTVRRWGR